MPKQQEQQKNTFVLYAYENPASHYRSYNIDTPDKEQHYTKNIIAGTYRDCLRVRIAICTDLKNHVYGSPRLQDLQEVFN